MTWHQGPSQGPSATASTTRGQAARMASAATTRGAACPRRVSVAKTRQDLIKMFLWAQQDKHGSPGRDVWTRSTGLGLAAAGGHESAAIRRAWVRGGHWVRGGPAGVISRERQAWGSGNPGTREPAGGLGIATAGYLPRSAGMRVRWPRETKHRNKIKTRKNEQNKTRWRGVAYG